MIRKLATIPQFGLTTFCLALLMGIATVQAQQTPAQPPNPQPQAQQPDQSSSSQEASAEETQKAEKTKKNDYKKWTFNVGGGASLTHGTTNDFVREGGGVFAAGVARNYSKYFGFRFDFQFDNLPLRSSALALAQAPGANSHVYSFMIDPIINFPVTKNWGGYVVFGPSFFHRSGKLDSSTAIPGSACNGFFLWWGECFAGSLPLSGDFLGASQNQFGFNLGGGITRKIRPNMDFYAEYRYLHGKHNDITTALSPITIGIRW
jgi:opacity protein-like surface antigen